ncbi:hypothetical protein B7Y94_00160 [Candidatus Saccharibacteria bacterium 32-49-12]|nr:MAG: hypothetical protein B7Y94_00160 [Candidatus Saccharibacteria bacterium 32-49-12]
MKQQKTSIDGFVSRRPQRSLLNERSLKKTDSTVGHMRSDRRPHAEVHSGNGDPSRRLKSAHNNDVRQEIGQSLKAIDVDTKNKKIKKTKARKKSRVFKIVGILVALVALSLVGFLLYKAWQVGGKVFQGNLMGIFQQQELKMDSRGRSNILVLGTTEDGQIHGGGDLTDSMMVVSVDQKKKDVYMFSIPRDLYVRYGIACLPGYEGKINAYFSCLDEGGTPELQKKRMDGMRQFVGELFEMDIQYIAHVNTSVIRDSVNAVGGVTVQVDSEDPRGVLDASLDWMCQEQGLSAEERRQRCPTGHYIDFKNGPNEMDGDKALWFSRARGAHGGMAATYGFDRGNFDREKNQQLVLMALKDKAASTGTLTDVGKVMGLMEAMGDNLRTNIESTELQTIMKLAQEINEANIHRLSFVDTEEPLMSTGNVGGQSIVRPVAGIYDYSQIRSFLNRTIYATPLTKEAGKIAVLNGGGSTGAAAAEAEKLGQEGLEVVYVGNAPTEIASPYRLFRITEETKPLTQAKLEQAYSVSASDQTLPFGLSVEADFVVVIGPEGP